MSNAKYLTSSWSVTSNHTLMIPSNFIYIYIYIYMDLTLRELYWIKFCMKLIAVTSHDNCAVFYHPFCRLVKTIGSFHWSGNSSSIQTELMSSWITIMFPLLFESVLLAFDHYLAIYTFSASHSNFNLRKMGPHTNGSAICISICLIYTFNNCEK
jgi:hypothetical protein